MEKLELKHIAPYFAYGLKCEILNYKCDYVGEKYGIINGYYFYAGEPHYTFKTREESGKRGDLIKPILRPLSDLIKEIEFGGEKFIPIERLLDIKTKIDWSYSDYLKVDKTVNEYRVTFNTNERKPWFGYRSDKNFFFSLDLYGNIKHVENQLELFEKMFEWGFDVNDLIGKGLAVDINTLSE